MYRIQFFNQGKIYELYARHVHQGELFGFIEISGFAFGEKSAVLVDPSEERLQAEFSGVKKTIVPMHSVIRIDEVEKEGVNKIMSPASKGDKVTPFPMPYYPPRGESD